MSAAALWWRQLRFERRMFWRNPSAAFFNFLLPLVFLVLVASAFARDDADALAVLVPGIAGMAVMTTTFTALAFNVTFLREQGILKRMRGTPIPTGSYLGALVGNAVLNAFIQVALVIAIGHFAYGVPLPREPLSLVAFTALGIVAFGALGVAFSHAIPNVDAAPAYVNAVFLPALFVSGVFYSTEALPEPLEAAGAALPLKHVVDGLAGAIVGGEGFGQHAASGMALAIWALVGIVAAVRWFRWE